jgi:hypothetical protein
MHGVESTRVQCPACGEAIELLIDCSVREQRYIEDCAVCCRPIDIVATVDENGSPLVRVSR